MAKTTKLKMYGIEWERTETPGFDSPDYSFTQMHEEGARVRVTYYDIQRAWRIKHRKYMWLVIVDHRIVTDECHTVREAMKWARSKMVLDTLEA